MANLKGLTVIFLMLMPLVDRQTPRESAEKPAPVDIAGLYVITGTNPDGTAYKGGAAIITKTGDSYSIRCVGPEGPLVTGVGLYDGYSLSVATYQIVQGALIVNSCKYNVELVEGKPKLVGRWTSVASDGKVGTETLTFVRRLD